MNSSLLYLGKIWINHLHVYWTQPIDTNKLFYIKKVYPNALQTQTTLKRKQNQWKSWQNKQTKALPFPANGRQDFTTVGQFFPKTQKGVIIRIRTIHPKNNPPSNRLQSIFDCWILESTKSGFIASFWQDLEQIKPKRGKWNVNPPFRASFFLLPKTVKSAFEPIASRPIKRYAFIFPHL